MVRVKGVDCGNSKNVFDFLERNGCFYEPFGRLAKIIHLPFVQNELAVQTEKQLVIRENKLMS